MAMQHAVFPHQNPYQPDWQHHPHAQNHHQYAQTQAAAAASAAAQQQGHYGRMTQQNGNSNGANSMSQALTPSSGREADHAPASMMGPGDSQWTEENRKVLDW